MPKRSSCGSPRSRPTTRWPIAKGAAARPLPPRLNVRLIPVSPVLEAAPRRNRRDVVAPESADVASPVTGHRQGVRIRAEPGGDPFHVQRHPDAVLGTDRVAVLPGAVQRPAGSNAVARSGPQPRRHPEGAARRRPHRRASSGRAGLCARGRGRPRRPPGCVPGRSACSTTRRQRQRRYRCWTTLREGRTASSGCTRKTRSSRRAARRRRCRPPGRMPATSPRRCTRGSRGRRTRRSRRRCPRRCH